MWSSKAAQSLLSTIAQEPSNPPALKKNPNVILHLDIFFSHLLKRKCAILLALAKWTSKLMQVDTSLQNQNLHTDLYRVAKQIHKFAQVAKSHKCYTYTCNQLVSACVGWPNGEKLASTCVWIWVRPKPMQVHASRWPNERQVQNLHWFASLFVQGFRLSYICQDLLSRHK